ncbi:MAG: BREX system P-loop protein BrxC, partial [Lachnospiraceae bacterium]|nr:BREX system P-loop protein BrxC [Lachnospiraceae bacterium]
MKQRLVSRLHVSMHTIIKKLQEEADAYEASSADELKEAIENAAFYVDGEHLVIKGGDAKSKIDQALEYLVIHVYSDLDLITKNAETDADIYSILRKEETLLPGTEPNRDAAAKMEEYLVYLENEEGETV